MSRLRSYRRFIDRIGPRSQGPDQNDHSLLRRVIQLDGELDGLTDAELLARSQKVRARRRSSDVAKLAARDAPTTVDCDGETSDPTVAACDAL